METDKIHNEAGRFVTGHNMGRPKGSGNKKLNVVREKFQLLLDGVRYIVQTRLMVRKVYVSKMRVF